MRAWPPPHLYGLPAIRLAAAMIARSRFGAPRGMAALPLVRSMACLPATVGVVTRPMSG